jgi:hypothetical protein
MCLRHRQGVLIRSGLQGIAAVIALLASALIICSSSASASLRLVGNPTRAELWQCVYDQMPCCWKTERAVVVQELSEAEMTLFIARRSGKESASRANTASAVDGCYQRGGSQKGDVGTICLCCAQLDRMQAELVFAHEYGHFVWDEKLTKAQRNTYKRLWRQQKRAGHLVTKYAGADLDEGFAEAVAYFLRQPDALRRRDPESFQFFTDLSGMEKAPVAGDRASSCCP